MQFQVFMITVIGMAAVSAIAAISAMVMLFRHLSRGQMLTSRQPAFNFDQAAPGPASTLQQPQSPRDSTSPPPPPPPPRLSLYLIAPDAPEVLRIPLRLTRGRILEINLPLVLSWTGQQPLEDLVIKVQMPNDITYGASLEHMLQELPPAALPGASVSYGSAQARTSILIVAPWASGGAEATFALPISVTQMSARSHPVLLTVSAMGMEPIVRNYVLDLFEETEAADDAPDPGIAEGVWLCRPDEAQRERHPHLPLDRIASDTFAVTRA